MMKKLAVGATLLCAAGFTQADTISYTDTVDLTVTSFTDMMMVNQFDDNSGNFVLDSVLIELSGMVERDARLESLDAAPATIDVSSTFGITFENAATGVSLSAAPVISELFSATAFDAGIDFAGTSGIDLGTASEMFSESTMMSTPMDLSAFIGAGMLTFDFGATGASVGAGAGNLITQFATRASGDLMITYNYTDNTPPPVTNVSAPSSVALLGLSLLGVAGLRRKAKK